MKKNSVDQLSGPLLVAFTQDCHGMVYDLQRGGQGGGVVYCATVVQYYYNSVGIVGGGGAIQGCLNRAQKL